MQIAAEILLARQHVEWFSLMYMLKCCFKRKRKKTLQDLITEQRKWLAATKEGSTNQESREREFTEHLARLILRQRRNHRRVKLFTFVGSCLVVLGFTAGVLGYLELDKEQISLERLAAFGSYLQGAVTSLWSLAALLFIYVAYLGQKQQFFQQDVQLAYQREQFAIQQDSITSQNFESSFFQLLTLHHEIVSQVLVKDSGIEYRGEGCFEQLHRILMRDYMGGHLTNLQLATREQVAEVYLHFYEHYRGPLGHYFRTLYHIFKFVHGGNIAEKKRYSSLARAQLSQYELALLCYHGITPIPPETTNNFKKLIVEFELLDNLDEGLLRNGHSYKALYLEPSEAKAKGTP